MSKLYQYCNGSILTGVTVTLTTSSCSNCTDWAGGHGCDFEECYIDLTFTLDQAAVSAVTVYYTNDFHQLTEWSGGGSGSYEDWQYGLINSVVIPAGQLSVVVNKICTLTENCIGDEYDDTDLKEWYNWALATQPEVPVCAPVPVTCLIEITGNTITAPVIRGDDDGSINIALSGATGQTIVWKINGVTDVVNNLSQHTFTGLEAGSYVLLAMEGGDSECFDQETYVVPEGEFRTGDFVVNQPEEITATENPIMLTLQTALNSTAPVPSKSDFDIDGTVTDGDSITIALTYPQAYTAVFYAKGFPDKDNYFLASVLTDDEGNNAGSNTANEIATSLGEVFLNDSVLNRLYYVRVSSNVVYLEAKENNSNLDLDTGTVTISATNIDLTLNQAGISAYDGQIESNYSLYAEVFVDNDSQYGDAYNVNNFNRVSELDLPFSQDNIHKFDLSEVLKNFVSTPKIDFTITGATTLADMMASYYVKYGEKYPLIPNSTTKKKRSKGSTSQRYIINSALEWEDVNYMDEYLGGNLHDVQADYTGTVDYGAATLTISDIYFSTGTTGNTTGIQYKCYNGGGSQTIDWQDSNVFTGLTGLYPNGSVWVSGITSGATFSYKATWYSTPWSGAVNPVSSDFKGNILFLTDAPDPKFIQRDSSEFLYFILKKNYGRDMYVKADLYFYDGTSLSGETLYTVATGGTNYGGVFCTPSGYNELNLASYETYSGGTRKIRKVEFAVYQTDDAGVDVQLTEERAYRYEIDEQPRRYGVAFLNKRGTWDIVDFSGEIIDGVERSNEAYQVPRTVNFQGASPKGFQANTVYGTKVTKTIACNTGWINQTTFDWLIELLSSNRVYNYTNEDQPFLKTMDVNYNKSSNDDLYQIDVIFTETLEQNNISV